MPGTNSYPTLCLNAEKMRGDKVFEIVFLEVNILERYNIRHNRLMIQLTQFAFMITKDNFVHP